MKRHALRIGDKVLVHDWGSVELALDPGVVVMVETHKGANGVGIRVASGGGETVILWPSYRPVHSDPRDPTETCWQCQSLAERPRTAA
jgi:hypothetical protein